MSEEKATPILSRLRAPEGAVRGKRRKGRGPGSGLGKTAGKGQKGQKARHPGELGRFGFEGGQTPLFRRIPKRGFINHFAKKIAEFNLDILSAKFEAGATIDEASLREVGLIKTNKPLDGVKILGNGELDKALNFKVHAISAGARKKVEAAGGTIEILA